MNNIEIHNLEITNIPQTVLTNIDKIVVAMAENNTRRLDARVVCPYLGIFDWWKETISSADLNEMKSFLELALSLGLTGYCCFKVGAEGWASGMWAYEDESTDDSSPTTGNEIYRTFLCSGQPKRYVFRLGNENTFSNQEYNSAPALKKAFLNATQTK